MLINGGLLATSDPELAVARLFVGHTFYLATPDHSVPGFGNSNARAASGAANLANNSQQKLRWRASKGSAPVNRFTRSFGNNQTEGWHRTMPVGIEVGGGALTLTLDAVATFSGTFTIASARDLAASLELAGTAVLATLQSLASSLDVAGAVSVAAQRTLAASSALVGESVRGVARTFDGALGFAGAVATQVARVRALAGELWFSAEVTRSNARTIDGTPGVAGAAATQLVLTRVADGAASFAGAFVTLAARSKAAGLSFAGELARTVTLSLVLAGVLTWQVALSSLSQFLRTLQGVLDMAGVASAYRLVLYALTLQSDLSFSKQLERFKRRLRFRSIFPGADPHRRYPPR